jgi:GT2 family glycosyltransferase
MPEAESPLVSLIVVNWNGRHLLEACLAALEAQTFRDFETVVVDNGSTDGSSDWVAEHYPQARLVRLAQNCGFSAGNNVGLRAARGRYLALLNNDAEPRPAWLQALVEALEAHPEAGACDSHVYFRDRPDRLWAAGGDYTVSGSVLHRGYLQPGSDGAPAADVFIAIACAAIYRREALDKVGLFDEGYFSGYEDVDLSFRLHAAGYRVLNVPGAVVYHRVSETAGLNSPAYVFHGQKNVLTTFVKNMPGPLLWKYAPLHLAYTLGALLYFARLGRLGPALRGKWFVLRHWGEVMDKRRAAQRLRAVPVAELDRRLSRAWFRPKLGKLLA